MFTIEKRKAKNGNVYVGIFPDGGRRPIVVNNYHIICPLLGVSFSDLAAIRKSEEPLLVRFDEK